jgi:hypothetical protein
MSTEPHEPTGEPRFKQKAEVTSQEPKLLDLAELGIEAGGQVTLEQVENLFEKKPDLIEGAKRNFYWSLRRALESDFQRMNFDWFTIGRRTPERYLLDLGDCVITAFHEYSNRLPAFAKKDEEEEPTDRQKILGNDYKKKSLGEIVFRLSPEPDYNDPNHKNEYSRINLRINFAVDNDRARQYSDEGGIFATLTSSNDFEFMGLSVTTDPGNPRLSMEQAKNDENIRVDYDKIKQLAEALENFPDADCGAAIAKLKELAKDYNLSKEEVEKIEQSITEFATFVKPEPTTGDMFLREIGRCLSSPHAYAMFCQKKFDIKMETDYYGDSVSFFHQVNTFKGIAIDWTARQFSKLRNTAYPHVYPCDEKLFDKMQLHSRLSERKKKDMSDLQNMVGRFGVDKD